MLPSKGYFRSLNCPYFNNGYCDRPHCHFRHTRKDKFDDDNQLLLDTDQATQASEEVGGESSDSSWHTSQQSTSTSISYKPTPIVELKKRHIPITTAPSVVLSSTSQKRRIEYDVVGFKKPKVEYIPESVNSEPHSRKVHPTSITSSVYRATKICDHAAQLSNGATNNDNAILQDNDESEGEIDFDQVSNELNFLDEILKEYEKPVSISKLLDEAHSDEIRSQEKNNHEQIKNPSKVLTDKVNNSFPKHCQNSSEKNKSFLDSHETKNPKDPDEKTKSFHTDTKIKNINSSSNTVEKPKQVTSSSISLSCNKDESKISSRHKQKPVVNHKSEKDSKKGKGNGEELASSTKLTEKELESESAFDELLKSESSKSSNSIKQPKKEHSSSSSKYSKKHSEHKSSSSSKSRRKDCERDSSSNKPSTKDSSNKDGSTKSCKKESDHQSSSSKSSKSKSNESNRKRTHSHESHGNSKKHKDSHKSEHKHKSESKESTKYKDESRHRKESNERRSSKKDRSSKERDKKDKSDRTAENSHKKKLAHSVSESEVSSDDVEIISESGSVIVIDSEEDSDSPPNNRRKVKRSPSPARSSLPSPTFPSDVSDLSDLENNSTEAVPVSNGLSCQPKKQDDSSLLDHRVQSRVKNRVSLGTTWRPPTKKSVEIMTPAQRLLLFAKLREQEENDSNSQSSRVKIGCVPNVKLLLQEKERLLQNKTMQPPAKKAFANVVKLPPSTSLDKDVAPTNPVQARHPTNRGADLYDRRSMLEKLYKVKRQLVEPSKSYKRAQDKCLEDEFKIWIDTNKDTYETKMLHLISQHREAISDFTLRYFTELKPKHSALFPPELKKKAEPGKEDPPLSEESLYHWLSKYLLSEEQLEKEGYPRKKSDSTEGTVIAYINKESLERWRKAKGVPPTGEYACVNCNKFYSVDENGLSIQRWECSYHAKKAWKTSKEKSGLLGKKARCCGNDMDNPCMSSEYHSTETRDMQNLEEFKETKDPHGEMPPEGWGIYSLDCEMFWSTRGLELGRVTVVNAELRTVYDTFVKPKLPVTDYSSRFSGLTKENLEAAKKTFSEVQNDMLKLFNSKTILIGHSLENDLKILQLVHSTVVDTAVVFMDGERKQPLKTLASELLKDVIQSEEDGHDSTEDAVTCLKLMILRVKKDAATLSKRAPPAHRGRYRQAH